VFAGGLPESRNLPPQEETMTTGGTPVRPIRSEE
jgi:hypothetical protein